MLKCRLGFREEYIGRPSFFLNSIPRRPPIYDSLYHHTPHNPFLIFCGFRTRLLGLGLGPLDGLEVQELKRMLGVGGGGGVWHVRRKVRGIAFQGDR